MNARCNVEKKEEAQVLFITWVSAFRMMEEFSTEAETRFFKSGKKNTFLCLFLQYFNLFYCKKSLLL